MAAAARKRPTRAIQKEETREKVIDVATNLFRERGYDAVTVRDIAAAAQVSVGTVVGAVGGKPDLFNEVLIDDYAESARLMGAAARTANGSTIDLLTAMMAVAYKHQLEQLELLKAGFVVSWLRSPDADRKNREGLTAVFALIADVLRDGISRGEVSADTNIQVASELIFATYLSNFRRAIYGEWEADRLTTLFRHQMDVMFNGLGARAA